LYKEDETEFFLLPRKNILYTDMHSCEIVLLSDGMT